jgi:hypothetical protein
MKTLTQLQDFAKKTGRFLIVETPSSDTRTGKTDYSMNVGIELKPNIYYWWKGILVELDEMDEMNLYFDHRYNVNNGCVVKSFRKGYEAEVIIEHTVNN